MFEIDLQVQIHVPDTRAPKVISMVGTMRNLVNEVLQAAVGNHFRNTLQRLEAVRFIETRQEVQEAALEAITRYLNLYEVETKGVYIQDVVFPQELVLVLTRARDREPGAGDVRRATARADGPHRDGEGEGHRRHAGSARAPRRSAWRSSRTRPEHARRRPRARRPTSSSPVAPRRRSTEAIGLAEAKAVEALGIARATGFEQQRQALGPTATAIVAVANAVAEGKIDVMPDVLVTGGGGSFEGLAATLMRAIGTGGNGAGTAGGTAGTTGGAIAAVVRAGHDVATGDEGAPETPLEAEQGGAPVGPGSA